MRPPRLECLSLGRRQRITAMTKLAETPEFDRLERLVSEKCNGSLGAEGLDELHALLDESPELRAAYWHFIGLHIDLHWLLTDREIKEDKLAELFPNEAVAETRLAERAAEQAPPLANALWRGAAIAAGLMLAVTTGLSLWLWSDHQAAQPVAESASEFPLHASPDSKEDLQEPSLQQAPQPVLADVQLVSLVEGSHWHCGRPGSRNPEGMEYGDTVWAEEGVIEMRLAAGAVGVLRAPVILQLVRGDRVRLLHGRIMVNAPEQTNGFTVETPSAEVVDQGTLFSVEAAEEGTDLVVFGGKVDLNIPHAFPEDGSSQADTVQLVTGEAVHVDSDGTLSRIMSVLSSTDPMRPDAASRTPVIESVADNNRHDDHWDFYEIVSGGMGEDAPAYVDRFHEWNGATPEGMPSYLVGGDYVKVFNEDKAISDLQLVVELSQPSNLYVLLDKRVPAPDWLVDSFVDTGDEIGIDESPHNTAHRFPANVQFAQVGPGESIDRTHSIWKATFSEGGAALLGPNGQMPLREGQDARPHYIRANMYGVVAVPLSDDPKR